MPNSGLSETHGFQVLAAALASDSIVEVQDLTWSVPTIHKNKYGIFSYVSMHVVMSAYQYVSYHGRIY